MTPVYESSIRPPIGMKKWKRIQIQSSVLKPQMPNHSKHTMLNVVHRGGHREYVLIQRLTMLRRQKLSSLRLLWSERYWRNWAWRLNQDFYTHPSEFLFAASPAYWLFSSHGQPSDELPWLHPEPVQLVFVSPTWMYNGHVQQVIPRGCLFPQLSRSAAPRSGRRVWWLTVDA